MHRKPTYQLLPFDLEIERTFKIFKKSKGKKLKMEDNQSDIYTEGHSD